MIHILATRSWSLHCVFIRDLHRRVYFSRSIDHFKQRTSFKSDVHCILSGICKARNHCLNLNVKKKNGKHSSVAPVGETAGSTRQDVGGWKTIRPTDCGEPWWRSYEDTVPMGHNFARRSTDITHIHRRSGGRGGGGNGSGVCGGVDHVFGKCDLGKVPLVVGEELKSAADSATLRSKIL